MSSIVSNIVSSKYIEENLASEEKWVIWSWVPYYLNEKTYTFTEQVKSAINCFVFNMKNKWKR